MGSKLIHKIVKTDELIVTQEDVNKYDSSIVLKRLNPRSRVFKIPVLINKNGVVVSGQRKVLAARKIGVKELLVTIASESLELTLKSLNTEPKR